VINSPITSSLLAEIEAICLIFRIASYYFAFLLSYIASTALSIPRFKSIGFAPAATFFKPSLR
jgi:hypothetical protein